VVYTEPDGNEALIALRGPGDLIGEYSQQDQGTHMATVWGLEDGEATVLASDALAAFLRENGLDEVLRRYILSKTRQGAQLFLEVVNADPVGGAAVIPMSQTLIAASLGVTRRSVNQLLSRWRERGLVRTQPSPITVLDLAGLARRANLR
jgi:CRP/FNR family cyclic AMP-dependent transcriptional regulator